ncbi:DNA-processing protein DprA [Accumulibacter sp.]|uniref:DNA-processing protein DprA n=1 Tax=Accumulibacter sp. TaxID=2053492 RepID=UPI0025F9EF85|nr:DNA-processing protein DprA [Accumulibacter sp.]MCM8594671.1 DNA-processing protein DprA [Accumulibacter sp.]MCM8625913.1 DNA-processing protein DprA [Accumulibacter sp.]MDS4048817.1 DNA-processing protein DprA [Accumulibacter sp.]
MDPAGSLASWLRLTLIPGLGGESQRTLLKAFGLPEAIFAASRSALSAATSNRAADLILGTDNRQAVERALAWAEEPDRHILTLADPGYPQSLLQIPDPPTLIHVRGRVELLNTPALAVVGSRNPTPQGMKNAEHFASAFAEAGLTVTSGLALGIDAAAHRGALRVSGNTLAFIGTGIDRVYPAANHALASEIATRGAIVSELPLGTPPVAANFPRRNRLIAGFTSGTLIVEATVQSGSLITARLASEQGRDVFAVPGSIHSPQSRGCHRLIREGAKLVETVEDVLEELHWPGTRVATATLPDAPEESDTLLRNMGFDPCGLDELATRTGLKADVVAVMLLQLELAGAVASLPGGRYQRLSPA